MFCNQCGKENKDGINFCVQCGNPLKNVVTPAAAQPSPEMSSASVNLPLKGIKIGTGIKTLVTLGVIAVLVLIAFVNIIRVYTNPVNINIYNDEQMANRNNEVYETKSYIYYKGYDAGGLYRVSKSNFAVTKISNKNLYMLFAATDGVYCKEYSGEYSEGSMYKIMDKSNDLERVTELDSDTIRLYVDGKFNYSFSDDGAVMKQINSDKYRGYSVMLNKGDPDCDVVTYAYYKDYVYLSMKDKSVASHSGYRVSRVSLKTGKEERLLDEEVTQFSFTGNQIVYQTKDGNFFVMNLNGSNQHELLSIDKGSSNFFCSNNYLYYTIYKDGKTRVYRYNMDGSGEKEVNSEYGIQGVSSGLAYVKGDTLTLLDTDGNVINEIKP